MEQLIPLEISHENGKAEKELKRLIRRLFSDNLLSNAKDVNVYGAPFLGSEALVRRYLAVNRINAIASEEAAAKDVEKLRYLLMAVISQNPKRGLHFLKLFIKCLWGDDFEIIQLYHHKDMEYPTGVYEPSQVERFGFSSDEMFLTSRLRIKLRGGGTDFPDTIPKLLESILPARLLIHDVLRQFDISAEASMFVDCGVISMNSNPNVVEYIKVDPIQIGDNSTFYGGLFGASLVKAEIEASQQ